MRRKFVLIFTMALIGVMLASSIWVRRGERTMQESFSQLRDVQNFEVASLRVLLADAMRDEDKDKALRQYGEALGPLKGLGRSDIIVARIMNSMAQVYCEKTPPNVVEAQRFANDAVTILSSLQSNDGVRKELVRALETLLRVYGPNGLNNEQRARKVAVELERVRAEIEKSKLNDGNVEPPPPAS